MNHLTKRPLAANLSDLYRRIFEPTLFTQETELTNLFGSDWVPRIDVKNEASRYLVTADVPGVDPKNIEVSLENDILTIRGQKETNVKEQRKGFICVERSSGSFYRSIHLPGADAKKIKAQSIHGVLQIIVPKIGIHTKQKIAIGKSAKTRRKTHKRAKSASK